MDPFVVRSFLAPAMLRNFREKAEEIKRNTVAQPNPRFGRTYVSDRYFDLLNENFFLPIAVEHFREPVLAYYSMLSFYHRGEGVCPPHKDYDDIYRTIDICLNQAEVWPIYVEDQRFDLEPGDALFFSGPTHRHWRDRIQPDNFCDLLFLHYKHPSHTGDPRAMW